MIACQENDVSQGPVHYELFIRRTASAPWVLEMATEARSQAVEAAEALLQEKRVIAAKVMKETLDPESGNYRSITVMTLGDLTVAKSKVRRVAQDEAAAPICAGPSDLYTVHAREKIGRLFDGWLRRRMATPFELLHRPDLAEALEASGMEVQHAIQKIAIPEAQATGGSAREFIRTYQKIADKAVERLVRDGRRDVFPDLTAQGAAAFAQVATRLATTADGAYLLGGAVAGFLKGAQSWSGKVELILDLADAAPADEARGFAFSVLSQPLSEILGSRGALADFVGADQDLGASLALLTRLVASGVISALAKIEPTLENHYPPLTPEIARLAGWLKDKAFVNVRATLARRILAEINGPRRLRPGDAGAEIQTLRALATVLMAFAGPLLPAEDVQAAFTERSRALVSSEFVQSYVSGAGSAAGEIQALIRLSENVVGGANKRAVIKWIAAAVGSPRFEREMRAGAEGPSARLAILAELQQQLQHAGLPEVEVIRLTAQLGEIGGMIESDTKLIQTVAKSAAPASQRLAILLKLANGETGPQGPVSTRAKAEIQKLVRAPETRSALVGSPELVNQLKELMVAA